MSHEIMGFAHRFVPAPDVPNAPTLLLLHGTGGNEDDLLQIGRDIAPDANLLSPRGKVLENGMPRFFRRFGEGVFDIEDVKLRAGELQGFVSAAAGLYGFDPANVTALGYSNGANIAGVLMFLYPDLLQAALLLRAMVVLVPEQLPNLHGKRIAVFAGQADPIVPPANSSALVERFRAAGADATLFSQRAGHNLTQQDLLDAKSWLAARA